MNEEEINQPISQQEEQQVETKKNETICCAFTIGLAFTLLFGIAVGLASGLVTYYYGTHEKTLLRSAIYGILTGVCGSISMVIIVITLSLF
jgi:hypothetical protein